MDHSEEYHKPFPKIWFGKYRGRRMNELPMSYLKWLLENVGGGYLRAIINAAHKNLPPPDPKSFVKLSYCEIDDGLVVVDAPFELVDDIKEIQGRGWDGKRKEWTVPRSEMEHVHRLFPKAVLIGKIAKHFGAYFTVQVTIDSYAQQTLPTGDTR